ncbi:RecB family nuclease, putative, TM0106 family [Xenococcus sp. PCC 7305]|uniref:TM0106 family RecB-like putative nuclease n=1 Tax=Xenococcus sp. PCC 7305 TaxID=102125 RepID=UPI0002ACDD67|nr:TM0106 family RecB-like putative nuclease [Xenococcus sp. PCC 7305]ELS01297.1 RecB family nuclease, putative, TM0106 family [Xenococcus sp. PCC 7305]
MLLTDELLLNYKRCRRRTFLEVYGSHQDREPTKEFLLKLKRENKHHVATVLKERSLVYQQPEASKKDWLLRSQQTLELMSQGVECIYRGRLHIKLSDWQSSLVDSENSIINEMILPIASEDVTLIADPTLLIKQPGKSIFGDWTYLPLNIKLGRRPKPEYKLIAAYHAQIIAAITGELPDTSTLILRQQNDYQINLEYWLPRMYDIVNDCIEMLVHRQTPEVFISRQRCSLCHWHSFCHEHAKSQKHLSLVPGITPKRYESLLSMGLDSLDAIAKANPSQMAEKIGKEVTSQLQQQVRSLLLETPLIRSSYNLQNNRHLPTHAIEFYFDIEAEPDRNLDYLLGILAVDRVNNTEEFYPFLAETVDQEAKIWQEFLEFVMAHPNVPIFHFSDYEVDTIKRLAALYNTPYRETKALLNRCVDIHHWVTTTVVLPVESYSLKSLANWLGFSWREAKAGGDQCVCWYDDWLRSQDSSLLDAILSYNEDDCYATYYLKYWLENFLAESQKYQVL